MGRQGWILVVDDNSSWRKTLKEILRDKGFHVDTAASHAEALQCLNAHSYHLIVLDIRMEEADVNDTTGMNLLRELDVSGLVGAVGVIMLSAYGTKEQMREAFRQYSVIDFINKSDFGYSEFCEEVIRVFHEVLHINLDLDIRWQQSNAEQVVINLALPHGRVKRDSSLQHQIAAELDDLLCRLFYQAESLLVRPMTPGRSGAGVLWAQPFNDEGAGRRVIVKFGEQEKIEQEYQHFKEYVEPFIGGGRSTTVLSLRRTPHLGGIEYSLLGTTSEHLESFENFYRKAEMPQIRSVLDNLFLDTCGDWYANPGQLQLLDLSAYYQQFLGLTPDSLEHILSKDIKLARDKDQLYFDALGDEYDFINPLKTMFDQHLIRPTYVCNTHGSLNDDNILIDSDGKTWAIDFERTGTGHILRDIVALDTAIRLRLLAPEEATLKERLHMEEALCSAQRFSDIEDSVKGFLDSTNNRALIKAFSTAVHLRSLARRLVSRNPIDDISELYIALFYYAVNNLRFFSLSTLQREHALLSASLLNEAIQGVFRRRYSELEFESLQIKFRNRGRFRLLSIASHQLKTPLGNIKAILENMIVGQYGSLSGKQQQRLEQALDSVNREFKMIERLLNLTRLESGKEKAELVPCNLVDCLRGALDDNRSGIERKGLKLFEDLPPEGIRITGDAILLTGAFSNVLENAIKFTEQGEVRVRCWLDNDWAQVEIRDTGIGISKDILPFIFDDSFQANSGLARQFEGLGAGLYLTRGWLQMHGGTIEAQSEINSGTAFIIRLPVHHQLSVNGDS